MSTIELVFKLRYGVDIPSWCIDDVNFAILSLGYPDKITYYKGVSALVNSSLYMYYDMYTVLQLYENKAYSCFAKGYMRTLDEAISRIKEQLCQQN